jgi:hypothetical protein
VLPRANGGRHERKEARSKIRSATDMERSAAATLQPRCEASRAYEREHFVIWRLPIRPAGQLEPWAQAHGQSQPQAPTRGPGTPSHRARARCSDLGVRPGAVIPVCTPWRPPAIFRDLAILFVKGRATIPLHVGRFARKAQAVKKSWAAPSWPRISAAPRRRIRKGHQSAALSRKKCGAASCNPAGA